MEIVRQPEGSSLCQACCIAMLCECSLEDVLSKVTLSELRGDHYLSDFEAMKFLLTKNKSVGMIYQFDREKLMRDAFDVFDPYGEPALLCVMSKESPGDYHAVVWCPDRKMILDPQYDSPRPLHDYEVVQWMPITTWEEYESGSQKTLVG